MLPSFVTQDLTKIVEYMRKDQDHVIFKRFERLHLYHLLSLQHRMTELDTKITTYEKEDDAEALAGIISQLEPLINSYNNALLAQDQIAKLQGTPEHLGSNIRRHASRNLTELKHELDPEAGWTELVSVGMAPKGWIHTFIDKHYQLQKLFAKHPSDGGHSSILLYSEESVRRAELALVNLAFAILVICPIFALSYMTNKLAKLFVVLCFVAATSFITSGLSDKAQKSSLAVMAGYTAILVVFLSNNVGTT